MAASSLPRGRGGFPATGGRTPPTPGTNGTWSWPMALSVASRTTAVAGASRPSTIELRRAPRQERVLLPRSGSVARGPGRARGRPRAAGARPRGRRRCLWRAALLPGLHALGPHAFGRAHLDPREEAAEIAIALGILHEGYGNLCRLLTRIKMRAAKGMRPKRVQAR